MGDRTVELKSGAHVQIRPIEADDRELLRRGFDRLSERSRYQRFFSPVASLSEGTIDYLTQVDHHDHEALIALDAESGELVGVARYVRLEDGVAEPAVTVIDEWQGRGLSGPLLSELVDRALEEGYGHFRAYALAENPRAIQALRRLGETTSTPEGATIQLDIDLGEPERARTSLGGLMRGIAEEVVSPTITVWRRMESVVRVAYEGKTEPWPGVEQLGDAIVVGADASESGRVALRAAVHLARTLQRPLHVVTAYRPRLDARSRADDLLRDIQGALVGCPIDPQIHLRVGDPAEALIEVAERTRARTIVVGAGGGAGRRYLVGNVSDKVARHAPCDVLVARARPPEA